GRRACGVARGVEGGVWGLASRPGEGLVGRARRSAHPLRRGQPIIMIMPRLTSHHVAGSGMVWPASENAALKVGGVVPPTMSVPMRSQSGARLFAEISSRVHDCRSVTPGGNGDGTRGRVPDSHRNSPVGGVISTCGTKK